MILCKHSKSYKVLWGRIFIIVYHAHGKNEKISNSFGSYLSIFYLILIKIKIR